MNDNPQSVARVLELLHQWGWETGYKKLEAGLLSNNEGDSEARELFLGWMAAERGAYDEALQHFDTLKQIAPLAGWALVGEAFVLLRQGHFSECLLLLDQSLPSVEAGATMLRASIDHLRGSALFHQGNSEEARRHLLDSLKGCAGNDLGTGRVLDTLGMIYGGKDNFHAAEEFFKKAIKCKQSCGDMAGLALSEGQLGRLYLSWGHLDLAEEHFQEDLRISQHIEDARGQAQMYNSIGQVALARAEREAAAGHQSLARQHYDAAADWNDTSIQRSHEGGWTMLEGFARKDRALSAIGKEELEIADDQLRKAEELFRAIKFDEGIAHINRTRGILQRQRSEWRQANTSLSAALRHFVDTKEVVEAARTQLEIARTLRAATDPRPLISQALLEALRTAECCRRAALIREVEDELKVVDHEAYCTHVYRRVRGRAVTEDTTSLIDGVRETATVLYLDIKGSTEYARGRDPQQVMMTLNQMMTELVGVLREYDARVSAFRGDGFLALLRGSDHAFRAVSAGLALYRALDEFNEPRRVLNLPLFTARIGIASGEVFLGNVGTYDKLDYTAIGTTANLGARLESVCEPGFPCISFGTYELVGDKFVFREGNPRKLDLKGIGEQQVWDVAGKATS